MDKLNNIGLYFETAIADQPATHQPVVTKKRVVECLQQIGQRKLAGILIENQGMCACVLLPSCSIIIPAKYVYKPKMRHEVL